MKIFFFLLLVSIVYSCKTSSQIELKNDFKKYYDNFDVDGTFVLFDQKLHKYYIYNDSLSKQEFTPASTFKICNTLIGLETKVITDENFEIQWDSIIRKNESWNKTQNLKSAFKNSTVWYYQELARRVGETEMKFYLEKLKYGNKNVNGGIDKFWLTGDLRITVMQQIEFLQRINSNKLPISKKSVETLKNIMLISDTNNLKIYAKTGWGDQNNLDVGWYVGFIETLDNNYYFANCIQTQDFNNKNFAKARIEIVNSILKEMKIK